MPFDELRDLEGFRDLRWFRELEGFRDLRAQGPCALGTRHPAVLNKFKFPIMLDIPISFLILTYLLNTL